MNKQQLQRFGEPDLDKMLQDLRQQSSVDSLMLQKEIQWILRVKREADRRPLDLPAAYLKESGRKR